MAFCKEKYVNRTSAKCPIVVVVWTMVLEYYSCKALAWERPIIFGGQEEIIAGDWMNATKMGIVINQTVWHFKGKVRTGGEIVSYNGVIVIFLRQQDIQYMDKERPHITGNCRDLNCSVMSCTNICIAAYVGT